VVLIGVGRGGKPGEDLMAGPVLAPQIGKRARKGRTPDSKLKQIVALRPVLPQ
jgi:topoisomerase IV subunit A